MIIEHLSFIILRAGHKEQSCSLMCCRITNFVYCHLLLKLIIAYRENMTAGFLLTHNYQQDIYFQYRSEFPYIKGDRLWQRLI